MKFKLPQFIKDIKINIQRWNFRRKYKSGSKVDLDKQLKAINKAEVLAKKRKRRLWVIRIMPGQYKIYPMGELKGVLKRVGLRHKINIFQTSDIIVHITK